VGYPGFRDLGNFLQGEFFLEGEQKFKHLLASNFTMLLTLNVMLSVVAPS